jgi:hypothetical protein
MDSGGFTELQMFGKWTVNCAHDLVSADSMAWSYAARRAPPLPGHDKPGNGRPRGHKNCANCADWALSWRSDIVDNRKARPWVQTQLCF